jgi:hypothetical protein
MMERLRLVQKKLDLFEGAVRNGKNEEYNVLQKRHHAL